MRDRNIYRSLVEADELTSFQLTIKETDLFIMAEKDLKREARELVLTLRHRLEEYIAAYPEFLTALGPLEVRGYYLLSLISLASSMRRNANCIRKQTTSRRLNT